MGVSYGLGLASTLPNAYTVEKRIAALRTFAKRSPYRRFVEVIEGDVYFFEALNTRVATVEKCEVATIIQEILDFYTQNGNGGEMSYNDCVALVTVCSGDTFGNWRRRTDVNQIPFKSEGGYRSITNNWLTSMRLESLEPDTEWYESLNDFCNYLKSVMAFCDGRNYHFLVGIHF
ncbi:MAG: hypothetical protein RL329_2888 [Bacteroidota bacterium]|jgi:hypothetical protein